MMLYDVGLHKLIISDAVAIVKTTLLRKRSLFPTKEIPSKYAGREVLNWYCYEEDFGIEYCLFPWGDHGSTMDKVLCYKSESHWFDPRWCHWNFSLT